LHGGRAQYL